MKWLIRWFLIFLFILLLFWHILLILLLQEASIDKELRIGPGKTGF